MPVCVLKQFEEETECETKGFVTVFVARSSQPGDIVMKTVPVLPAMTAVEVCKFYLFRFWAPVVVTYMNWYF